MTVPGWTVDEALAEYAAAGMPLDEKGFRAVVMAARRCGHLAPAGETAVGAFGGRGYLLYDIGTLQLLHADLAKWLAVPAGDRG